MFAIYLFNNLILLSLYFWYNRQLFDIKYTKKINILIIIIFSIIKTSLNLPYIFELNLIMTIIFYFTLSYFCFLGSNIKKILFCGLFIFLSFFSELYSYIFLNSFSFFNSANNFGYYIFTGNISSLTARFTVIFIITKFYKLKNLVDYKDVWYLSVFPIFSMIIVYLMINFNLINNEPIFCGIITAFILIFNIIICIGFTDIIKSKKVLLENEQLKNQKLNYQLMEEKFENSKRFVHSFKKHINILHNYISNHNYNEANQYINDLKLEISNNDNMIITNNPLIDIEIYSRLDLINYNHINLRYDIKIKELFFVSPLDFNTVFSIILENAIENCKESTGSLIKIKLDKKDDYIILKIFNSSNEINKLKAHDLKTVKKIVAKYDGYYRFNYDNHLFISTIIFKNS